MKKTSYLLAIIISMISLQSFAQKKEHLSNEKFGHTFNLGVGVGYYGYIGHSLPVIMANYELDVAHNFTLAPFIGFYSYSNNYYWGNKNYPFRYYSYRETVIPLGVKGNYYFDELLRANPKWDFYAAASVGFRIRSLSWDSGYYGDKTVINQGSPLHLDIHVGARYHINDKLGIFFDISSGISTLGISF
jgi:hypothetical protein